MWISEYVKLMYPKNMKNIQIGEAMELKYQNIPSALYKYRTVSKYSIENFTNDEVWFNTAAEFNDPYDCALTMSSDLTDRLASVLKVKFPEIINKFNLKVKEEEIEKFQNMNFVEALTFILNLDENLKAKQKGEGINGYARAIERMMKEEGNKELLEMNEMFQKGTLISCFSEVNDSILMWSHYATNHTGFCIEYNFKKVGIENPLTRLLQPVIYKDEMFDIAGYFLEARENIGRFNNLIGTYAAIIKSTEWSYEKEWRLAFTLGNGEGFSRSLFRPESIYLGAKISNEDKEKLIEIAKKKRISVFQMKMKNNEFKLVSEKIL
ncbi:Protein of unknown function [Bacillus cereus]|nr:Protein of unknown function [Bacillus cereus]